ncbi:MAG: hypothetical protein B7Z75_11000 [Acidocella sp. 20-57-95]|nr:MAG: hypothetical protein B7Z75_11000 [Acidocella sp. 20-57-95]OYV61953.1 MAG: hypothetical protein B7Z71_03150 [Acidocella sp. 21-58-7]HQT63401.1 hypothetical protein [Acidocella sp.]HQU04033.1 hypothetical protein [Acidocella sp.]
MKPLYLALFFSLLPALAPAQVIFHQAALDQLAGIVPPVVAAPVAATAPLPRAHKRVAPKIVAAAVRPATPPTPPAPPPVAVQPAVVPPVTKALPPQPVGLNFAAGSADLPADATAALKPICDHASNGGLVGVDAYAAADNADISAPMRLSLSRALAVRDALVACGVQAARILPRADGAVAGHAPDTAVVTLGITTGTNP